MARGINKRSRQLDGEEQTESNAQEVARKFAAGLKGEDLNSELRDEEWETLWIYSASELFAADAEGLMVFGDQSVPGSGESFEDGRNLERLPLMIPMDCIIEEAYLVSTATEVTSIGSAHSSSNYQVFNLQVNRDNNKLSEVGVQTHVVPFASNTQMEITGGFSLRLRKGDVVNLTYGIVGTPYPTSSGCWQVMMKVKRV